MDAALDRLELKISKFLRWGVLFAGALMATGWIGNVLTGAGGLAPLTHYTHVPLGEDVRRAWTDQDGFRLVAYAGLLTLIALPFTRVVLTAVLFVKQREWVLAGVAAFVALALIGSVVLGIEL